MEAGLQDHRGSIWWESENQMKGFGIAVLVRGQNKLVSKSSSGR